MYEELQRLYLKILENFIQTEYVNISLNNNFDFEKKYISTQRRSLPGCFC